MQVELLFSVQIVIIDVIAVVAVASSSASAFALITELKAQTKVNNNIRGPTSIKQPTVSNKQSKVSIFPLGLPVHFVNTNFNASPYGSSPKSCRD